MAIAVSDVRTFLADLPTAIIPDSTIEKCITVAGTIADHMKGSTASSDLIDSFVLIHASWLTLVSYASYVERSTGEIPAPLMERLRDLRKESELLLEILKRTAEGPIITAEGLSFDESVEQAILDT